MIKDKFYRLSDSSGNYTSLTERVVMQFVLITLCCVCARQAVVLPCVVSLLNI